MCGRFSQPGDLLQLADRFGIKLQKDLPFASNVALTTTEQFASTKLVNGQYQLRPRFNLAPSQLALTVVIEGSQRRFEFMRWGLHRQWGQNQPRRFITNLRSEKLAKGAFKNVLAERRCLIVANGFYEWKTIGKLKQPHRFILKDNFAFALPAIYDEPERGYEPPLRTFSIFTSNPNSLVESVHDRMPCILSREWEGTWLDRDLDNDERAIMLLKTYPAELMDTYQVSTIVNKAVNDSPTCIEPFQLTLLPKD